MTIAIDWDVKLQTKQTNKTMDSENMAYLWPILITVLKHMFWMCKRSVSLRHFFYAHKICLIGKKQKIIINGGGGKYFYVYLPIIRTTENSK